MGQFDSSRYTYIRYIDTYDSAAELCLKNRKHNRIL